MNKIWDLTNSNDMQYFLIFYSKIKSLVDGILEIFCSYGGIMTQLIHFFSVGGRSHFRATPPEGHIYILNSPNTTRCKMVPSQARYSVLRNFL